MITKDIYDAAVRAHDEAEKVILEYGKQEADSFDIRLKSGQPFTDAELRYAATDLCPCGHGIAYPKNCGGNHYWDCSAILKGIADKDTPHTAKLPFAFYEIKSEDQPSANGRTTRGVFRPKPST